LGQVLHVINPSSPPHIAQLSSCSISVSSLSISVSSLEKSWK
jgi:hypothetical protein